MKKLLLYTLGMLFTTTSLLAQNFEPPPGEVDDRLRELIKRYGSAERIYLNDVKRRTFEAKGSNIYLVAFVYPLNATQSMRMMVYEVGPNGEKKNIRYPDFSKGYKGPNGRMFFVRLDPEGDENTVTTYKVDTNSEATVYMYRAIPGVK